MNSIIFKQNKILFFLVETTVRELDFRLILAVMCAKHGWQIIIGNHVQLIRLSKSVKNGILCIKDTDIHLMHLFIKQNHRLIHLDEEGGIISGNKETWSAYLNRRLEVTRLRDQDYVCAWGSFQKKHYKSFASKCDQNIMVTGHPKFNLGGSKYRSLYQKEVADLRRKYGKIILINTNFGSNDCAGRYRIMQLDRDAGLNSDRRYFNIELINYCYKIEAAFFEIFTLLSKKFIAHTIVIRPHPSENMITYNEFCQYIPRAVVTREGALNAWLLASEVLIHNGCTTAVEGYQSGTPIVNYVPVSDERFDIVLPNLLGTTCRTANEVLTTLEGIFDKGQVPKTSDQNMAAVEEMIANFNPQIDAFKNIKNIISKCQDETPDTEIHGVLDPIIIRKILEYRLIPSFLWGAIKTIKNFFKPKTYKGSNKFPDFNEDEILEKIKIIEGITGKKVKVHFHTHRILSITAN